MMKMVSIGEIGTSSTPDSIIKTMALGSCVAVIMYDREKKAVSMAHVALPDSSIGSKHGMETPGYFADLAIPNMLEELKNIERIDPSDVSVKLIGGASIMDPNSIFNIGKRNVLALRRILWVHRLGAVAEDVGKNFSRTVWTEVNTGKIFVSSPKRGEWEL